MLPNESMVKGSIPRVAVIFAKNFFCFLELQIKTFLFEGRLKWVLYQKVPSVASSYSGCPVPQHVSLTMLNLTILIVV